MVSKAALVLGSASPIGAGLIERFARSDEGLLVLADSARRLHAVHQLIRFYGIDPKRTEVIRMDADLPFAGIPGEVIDRLGGFEVALYHLAHLRDRELPAFEIRAGNDLMLERAFALAYKLPSLTKLLVVTDVGLIGDYPGRFSESWLNVGQTPFDEVDRSSLTVELSCFATKDLPIVRARIGLCFGPEGIPKGAILWPSGDRELVKSTDFFTKLPSFVRIPVAIAHKSLAPLTPVSWGAEALARLAHAPETAGNAYHLVLDAPPPMEEVLYESSVLAGGAKIRGRLPIDAISTLGVIPGFKETARRNADQIAAWWTPHRYCLSRNDLDTSALNAVLPEDARAPSWRELKRIFFRS